MKRTDIHRPAEVKPEEYSFVAFDCVKINGIGDAYYAASERKIRDAHMARTGGTYSQHAHGGNCMICGNANAMYTACFYHELTNTYVRVGDTCSQKMEGCDEKAFRAYREGVKSELECIAGKRKAQKILEDHGIGICWIMYTAEYDPRYEEKTIRDIVGALVKYGRLSDKQVDFLKKLLLKIDGRAAAKAELATLPDAAPMPVVPDCPEGRMIITGRVLTTKIQTSDYGDTLKMLVQHESGWKVWGTVPSDSGFDRGHKVQFTATVERSQNDSKFGYFKRPTKAPLLEGVTAYQKEVAEIQRRKEEVKANLDNTKDCAKERLDFDERVIA